MLHLSSIRDLLAVVTSFSLLSLYLTYHLGFYAGRLRSSDVALGMRRQDNLAFRKSNTDSPFRSPQLLDLLFKLEQKQTWTGQPVAVLRGRHSLLQRGLGFYSQVLRSHGFTVHVEDINTLKTDRSANWTLLLCFVYSDGDPDCFSRMELLTMGAAQRVNRILGLHSVLWKRSGLCKTASELSALRSLASRPITPMCFALPEQYEEFLNMADGSGFNSTWILKPSSSNGKLEHLSTMQFFNRVRLKEFPENQERLVQQFLPNQLRILGFPVSVQLFVLVTSVAPLRAYLYGEGFVSFRYGEENNYKKIPGKWWLLSQLWRHVAATQGSSTVKMALDNTDMLLIHLLLGAEAFLLVQIASLSTAKETEIDPGEHPRYRCEHCYQLLAIELMYNSSFYPVILGVSGQPNLGAEVLNNTPPSGVQENLRQSLLSDTLGLLFATDSVHRSVFDSLQLAAEEFNTGVTGLQCLISHDLCLTEDDLMSLLASRREMLNTGKFRRLYPTSSGSRYSGYLQELQSLMLQDSNNIFQPANSLFRETLRHSTSDLDEVQTRLEQVFNSQRGSLEGGESFSDPDPEPEVDEYAYPSETRIPPSLNLQSIQPRSSQAQRQNCSQDEALSAYLKFLELEPSVHLDPPFTPLWTDYHAYVAYDVTMVRVSAHPLHCHVQTRFQHRLGPIHALNTTLGLGPNRISVLLQDKVSGATLNTYLLTLHRYTSAHTEPVFESENKYAVCGLKQQLTVHYGEYLLLFCFTVYHFHSAFQINSANVSTNCLLKLVKIGIDVDILVLECEYRISPGEPCGLQEEEESGITTWPDTLDFLKQLPACSSGDAIGRWMVPCSECSLRESCVWSRMRWQPYHCSHRVVQREELTSCLRDKKLLFIGDSTNRGMMHYIMEQLNGSLSACDKTHHIRVYSNLNQGRTTLSFAYYPQFWLSAPERPVFDKTLYQLLLKSQPLQNTNNTIIIVGGVHWLATQHLHTLLRVLKREGLQQAHLVVKTLGSGFHIPAEGVHYLSRTQQKRLLRHSMGLAAFAKHHHMNVVDTFNMTAARYKDFLQGKCACHFHKLEERQQLGTGYHVEGPINAIYTEILLSRLCQNSV